MNPLDWFKRRWENFKQKRKRKRIEEIKEKRLRMKENQAFKKAFEKNIENERLKQAKKMGKKKAKKVAKIKVKERFTENEETNNTNVQEIREVFAQLNKGLTPFKQGSLINKEKEKRKTKSLFK